MPAAPTLSIGMPVYNGARYLAATLDSFRDQTHQDFAIWISDNGSTDTMGTVTKNGITVWLDSTVKSMVWVQWDQKAESMAHVEYSFDAGVWLSSPTERAPAGTNQRILVGIPFDTPVDIRLVADDVGNTVWRVRQ